MHLRLLHEAGVIWSRHAPVRRFELNYIPESVRRANGVLDYAFSAIRFSA
jgi:hypothetical protein